jgi:hypothetical protein
MQRSAEQDVFARVTNVPAKLHVPALFDGFSLGGLNNQEGNSLGIQRV